MNQETQTKIEMDYIIAQAREFKKNMQSGNDNECVQHILLMEQNKILFNGTLLQAEILKALQHLITSIDASRKGKIIDPFSPAGM